MDLLPWMERWHMLPPEGGVLLCAVSGGRDSVCLLHYLASIAPKHGFTVAAAHLNHQMRPEAQRDEDFVRELCRTLNVPFYTEAAPVYEMAERWGLGVEETGRLLRYDFFLRTADAIGAQRIATAHHAQDQAETVLLNLLRGTGPEGLGGIPPVRGRIVRPLLQTGRAEIEDYLQTHRLPHVEDSTNENTHYARNRLRRELWPQLATINPALERAIGRTAEIVRSENAYLDALAAERLPAEGTAVETAALLAAPDGAAAAGAYAHRKEGRGRGTHRRGAGAGGGRRIAGSSGEPAGRVPGRVAASDIEGNRAAGKSTGAGPQRLGTIRYHPPWRTGTPRHRPVMAQQRPHAHGPGQPQSQAAVCRRGHRHRDAGQRSRGLRGRPAPCRIRGTGEIFAGGRRTHTNHHQQTRKPLRRIPGNG